MDGWLNHLVRGRNFFALKLIAEKCHYVQREREKERKDLMLTYVRNLSHQSTRLPPPDMVLKAAFEL